MWRFTTLTPEEKERRRALLDLYGLVAQLSAFVPLAAVLVCSLCSRWQRRRRRQEWRQHPPNSPELKLLRRRQSTRLRASAWVSGVVTAGRTCWRRVCWAAGDEVDVPWLKSSASYGQLAAAAGWACWLVYLSVAQTGDDYLHLTKRLGTISVSQLPLLYALSVRSSLSPLALFAASSSGHSWQPLLRAHQLLGRIVVALLATHSILYLFFFTSSGLLSKRLRDADVPLGLTALGAFILSAITATKWVKVSYALFYTLHVAVAAAVLPLLWLHVSHARVYVAETVGMVLLGVVLKRVDERRGVAEVRMVKGTRDVLEVSVRVPSAEGESGWSWKEGQHVFLALEGGVLARMLASGNPFTIASLPRPACPRPDDDDGDADVKLQLVARVHNGTTARLARCATSTTTTSSPFAPTIPVRLRGPYGAATHVDRLCEARSVLLLAGGVGATFILPLHRALMARLARADVSTGTEVARRRGRKQARCVWAVRDEAEVAWAGEGLNSVEIYVTRAGQSGGDNETGEDDSIALVDQPTTKHLSRNSGGIRVQHGRPPLDRLIHDIFTHARHAAVAEGAAGAEDVAVVVCGPPGMAREARRLVGECAREKGLEDGVWFWSEAFG